MKNPISFLHGIIATIILSMVLLVAYIIFSNRNTFELVESDYYQKGLAFQNQIERIKDTSNLDEQLVIEVVSGKLVIQFPSQFKIDEIGGAIVFFRPSNSNLDRVIPVVIDENGIQEFDMSQLEPGAWTVKVYWKTANKEYYSEKRIFVDNITSDFD